MATAINKSAAGAGVGASQDTIEAHIRKPFTVIAGSTEADVILAPDLQYWIQHNVLDGSAAASTAPVFIGTSATITATDAAGDNKLVLLPDHPQLIGPGISRIYYKTASANVSMSFNPSPRWMGSH